MFGRERRLTSQFIVSLELTGSTLLSLLHLIRLDLSKPNVLTQPFTQLFSDVFFAFSYLALPFIFVADVDCLMKKVAEPKSVAQGESEKVKSSEV